MTCSAYNIIQIFFRAGHLLLLLLFLHAQAEARTNFDRTIVGVGFSPYVDALPGRNWNEYSLDEITQMLKVIRTKFSHISTYSMGVQKGCADGNWDQCDSNAIIARAAAHLNNDSSSDPSPHLSVNIGAYQTPQLEQKEIDNAFLAAADANQISRNTVWGICFTNEYVTSAETGKKVLDMIRRSKSKAAAGGIKLGARIHKCGAISEESALGRVIREIVKESDFIYCNVYASSTHAHLGPTRAAQEVGNYINGLAQSFKGVKSTLDFRIGETGWPSADNSFNDSENNRKNLVLYWQGIGAWANASRIQTQMFQGMDEPWKARDSRFKAESHYGWWFKSVKLERGRNQIVYIEKETGQEFPGGSHFGSSSGNLASFGVAGVSSAVFCALYLSHLS